MSTFPLSSACPHVTATFWVVDFPPCWFYWTPPLPSWIPIIVQVEKSAPPSCHPCFRYTTHTQEGRLPVSRGGQQRNECLLFNWEMKNRNNNGGGGGGGGVQNDNSCTSNGTCAKSHMITIGSEAELTLNQLK